MKTAIATVALSMAAIFGVSTAAHAVPPKVYPVNRIVDKGEFTCVKVKHGYVCNPVDRHSR